MDCFEFIGAVLDALPNDAEVAIDREVDDSGVALVVFKNRKGLALIWRPGLPAEAYQSLIDVFLKRFHQEAREEAEIN